MSSSSIRFTTQEKLSIAAALAALAAADGAIKAREQDMLEGFVMSGSEGDESSPSVSAAMLILEPVDLGALARMVVEAPKRHEVLRLCVRMALVDGDMADEERALLTQIAEAFELSVVTLTTLVDEFRAQRR
jgi:tellurite resistance protein